MVLALAIHVGHFLVYTLPQPWYIEDAAISFAYARNWVDGYGLVPFVGGEHIEGYSNPLWTFLLGFCYFFGASPWWSAKVMGALFGCVAQLFAWGIARRALPEGQKWAAVLAPLLLGASVQFALWNASGLENSLFCMLLAAGIYRVVVEVEDDDPRPLSALAFVGLMMTRPDGLAYAGIGLLTRVMGTFARGQYRALLYWALAFSLPYAAYFAWRFQYFAWEWPNTWYAKRRNFDPTNWNQLGWKQMREYTWNYGILWVAPLIAGAVTGFAGWRKWVLASVVVLMCLAAGWDGKLELTGVQVAFLATLPLFLAAVVVPVRWLPHTLGAAVVVGALCVVPGLVESDYATVSLSRLKGPAASWLTGKWAVIRVGTLGAGAAVIGLLSFGQRGWLVRGVLWCTYSFGLFYTILATGDWMKAYRWYSLTSVPQFVLLAVGAATVAELLPWAREQLTTRIRLGAVYAIVPALAIMLVNPSWAYTFAMRPETAPRDVHKRVEYMRWVQSRLDIERPTLLDVDMGAHLWWTDWFIADIAGLVDVPMAQHEYEKAFMKEYLFTEVRPTFAHVHGSWAGTMKINAHPEWKEQYIEIPGYPTGKRSLHVGNHVRKDLIAHDVAPPAGTPGAAFAGGVRLESWSLPAPVVARGAELYVDTLWRSNPRKGALRVLVFLARDGKVAWSGEVTPGYGWYEAEKWKAWEYVEGNWSVNLPKLEAGEYAVGLVLLDSATGAVIPALPAGAAGDPMWGDEGGPSADPSPAERAPEAAPEAAPAAEAEAPLTAAAPPVYMVGELLLGQTVRIVDAAEAVTAADAALSEALRAASAGECDEAHAGWRNARRHAVHDRAWQDAQRQGALDAIVACHLAAVAGAEPVVGAERVARARAIDPKSPLLGAVAGPLGVVLDEAGMVAAADHDWETAFVNFRAAVQADPSRTLSRRRAEDMRDRRLKIRDYDPKKGTKDAETASVPDLTPFRE